MLGKPVTYRAAHSILFYLWFLLGQFLSTLISKEQIHSLNSGYFTQEAALEPGMVAYTFNASIGEAQTSGSSLVYGVSAVRVM